MSSTGVSIIVGSTGAGKSHYIVKKLAKEYAKYGNCMIMTNFHTPLATHHCFGRQDIFSFIKTVRDFKEDHKHPSDYNPKWKSSAVVIVIDEASGVCNADAWKEIRSDDSILTTLREGRKKDIIIYLLTQSYGLIEKNFRRFALSGTITYFKPIIPLKRYKKIPIKNTRGETCYRREERYLLPIFNKFVVQPTNEDQTLLSEMQIKSRSIHLSGWASSKYYKLYDSFELISTTSDHLYVKNDLKLILDNQNPNWGQHIKNKKKPLLHTLKSHILNIIYKLTNPLDKKINKLIDKLTTKKPSVPSGTLPPDE